MVEYTTIKVSKPLSNYIANIKSVLEYLYGKKYTLEDALFQMCAITDMYYAKLLNIIAEVDSKDGADFVNRRIKLIWEGEEDFPIYEIMGMEEWWQKSKKKK